MRSLLTAAVLTAAAAVLSPASAQTPPGGAPAGDPQPAVPAEPQRTVPAPSPRPSAPPILIPETDNRNVPAPLTTGERAGDIATTTPVQAQPGIDGDAPDDSSPALAEMMRAAPAADEPEVALAPGAAAAMSKLTVREAQTLIGRDAVSREGERLGVVRDFVVQGSGTRVEGVILGRGGVLGLGEGLVQVPAGALRLDPAAAADTDSPVRLDLPKKEIEAMPAFTYADGVPTLAGPKR